MRANRRQGFQLLPATRDLTICESTWDNLSFQSFLWREKDSFFFKMTFTTLPSTSDEESLSHTRVGWGPGDRQLPWQKEGPSQGSGVLKKLFQLNLRHSLSLRLQIVRAVEVREASLGNRFKHFQPCLPTSNSL